MSEKEEQLRGFRPLFYTGTLIELITVPVHLFGMLHKQVPSNDQEKMLYDLLHNYRFDLGAGFVRTMSDFLIGFGLIYAVFFLVLGLINVFAIRQAGDSAFLRTLCWLNMLLLAACTLLALKYFFLVPLLFSLAPCLAFLGAALTAPRRA